MPRMRLGEILVKAGVLREAGLASALSEQRRWGGHLGNILVEMGLVPEDTMVQALSRQLNLPMVRLDEVDIPRDVTGLITADLAEQHRLVPFKIDGKFLDVAMSDPTNMGIVDELRIRTQLNPRPYLAGPRAIQRVLSSHYGRGGPNFGLGVSTDPAALPPNVDVIEFGARGATRQNPTTRTTPPDDEVDKYPSGVPTIRYGQPGDREAEINALQERLVKLEALVARDEDVLRKVLGLLVEKGVASRDEILERIK